MNKATLKQKGLFKQSETIILPAGAITENSLIITAQRGNVQAVGLVIANGTDLQYSQVNFTLSNNGNSFENKGNLLSYSPNYRYNERTLTPIELDENGVLNYSFKNNSAVAITVVIEMYFYNPFDQNLR